MITALFRDWAQAERACDVVVARGYQAAEISVVMSDATRARDPARAAELNASVNTSTLGATPGATAKQGASDSLDKAVDGETLGGPIGGTLGTIAPAVAAAGTVLLIPGLIFAGPVMVALAAAGAVGAAGGLIGALATWGVPKTRVSEYESGVRAGGILLGVKPHSVDDTAYLEQQWQAIGGESVHS
jgi:hypothetical protein